MEGPGEQNFACILGPRKHSEMQLPISREDLNSMASIESIKPPEIPCDFFEHAKPSMLEELIHCEEFERTADKYFTELGYTNFLTMLLDFSG